MQAQVDLNDIRYFLAVADAGSLSGAARALGVAQPTVGRRIKALESGLGARLFDRTAQGYAITAAGLDIVEAARNIEENAWVIQNKISDEDAKLSGTVRLTTSEGLGNCWLAAKLPAFSAAYPNIELDLLIGTTLNDLLRREADIALRIGTVGSDELVGRCLGQTYCGIYAARDYLQRNGEPGDAKSLKKHQIIDSAGDLCDLAQVKQFKTLTQGAPIAFTSNSLVTQLNAARHGVGVATLPSYMTTDAPELQRLLGSSFEVRLDIWLVTHRELRTTARITAVRSFIQQQVDADTLLFTGIRSTQSTPSVVNAD